MPFYDPTQNSDMGDISIPAMDAFSQMLAKQLKQSAGIGKIEVIKLGNPAATAGANDLLTVPSNPNYLYYTTEGEEGAGIGIISKEIIPPSLRYPNKTLLIFRVQGYVSCLSAAGIAEEVMAEMTPPVTPDQTPVTTSQLDFAVLQPIAGSMYAVVKGAIYGDTGVADLQTADMSSSPLDTTSNPIDIPTNANKAIGVLVQLDPSVPELTYKQSAEFPASLSLAQAYQNDLLPLRDDGMKRTGYIKLASGTSSLSNANVWPCPEFFPSSANANELVFDTPLELEISSGAITVTDSWHTIETEGGAGSDDLETINGLETGRFYLLQAADATHTVVVKSGADNIRTFNGVQITLSGTGKGLLIWYDGVTANVLTTLNNPFDMLDWGGYPDNSITSAWQDVASGDFYEVNGDEMQFWRTYQFSGAVSINAVPNLHLLFNSSTAFQVGINASTPLAGMAWLIQCTIAPGAGNHTLKLPSGCTFDGTNNTISLNATTDVLEGIWISSTRFLIKTNVSVALSTT